MTSNPSKTDRRYFLVGGAALLATALAGRAGAATDHSAVLFNVDPETGVIKAGTWAI